MYSRYYTYINADKYINIREKINTNNSSEIHIPGNKSKRLTAGLLVLKVTL